MTEPTFRRPPLDHARLAGTSGWRVEVLPQTPSTNAVTAERARAGAESGLVVVTEHQTAGRGRLDRGWTTPARSALTFSLLLRPDVPAQRWPWLPLMTGVAVAETLRELGHAAGLKWPNDVLIQRSSDGELRKVCGILVERVEAEPNRSGAGPAAVIGIGVNTSLTEDELPTATGTSLALESEAPVDRTALLLALLGRLDATYRQWHHRPDALAEAYRGLSVTIGRQVRAELPGGEVVTGVASAIDDLGRVVVAGRAIGAGDVVHARLE